MPKKSRKKKSHLKHLFILFTLLILGGIILILTNTIRIYGKPKYYQDNNLSVHLQSINFQTYLFDNKTNKKLYGLQTIDKNTIYLNPTSGAMEYGFHKIDEEYYYFKYFSGVDDAYTAYQHLSTQLKTNNPIIEKTIASGLKLVNKSPYKYGGGRHKSSIDKNQFDCSSFVAWMYHLGGQDLVYQFAASTSLLSETGTIVSWNNKQRGDLLITPATNNENEQHVAIYLGDGFILHDSVSTGGVNISSLNQVIDPKVLGSMTWAKLFEDGTVNREVKK